MLLDQVKKSLKILPQPTDVSCGPTCLQSLYDYYDDPIDLETVISEVKQVKGGGTLAVMLANHALKRGYQTTIYTYNLHVFDPTWFEGDVDLSVKLKDQQLHKQSPKLKQATTAYLNYLEAGGAMKSEVLTPELLKKYLVNNVPILTGLSATYLYGSAREIPETNAYDDIKGQPSGHFVVLGGYNSDSDKVLIADPLDPNPISDTEQYYAVGIDRVINAILLGIVTYDANLLIIEPKHL